MTASVAFEIPSVELPRLFTAHVMKKACRESKENVVKFTCHKYTPSLNQYLTQINDIRKLVMEKLSDLNAVAYENSQTSKTKLRTKRFAIGPAISLFSSLSMGLGKLYSEFINKKRISDMNKAIKAINEHAIADRKDIIKLKSDLSLLKSSSDIRYQELKNKINSHITAFNSITGRLESYASKIEGIVTHVAKTKEALIFINQLRAETKEQIDYQMTTYRDIINFARHNQIPLVALNLEKDIVSQVFDVGTGAASHIDPDAAIWFG